MADYTLSPNMDLRIPTVGVDPGPNYAIDLNASLTLVDSHDHSPGFGVPITPSGMNITSDLTFNNNNIDSLKSLRLEPQSAILSSPADISSMYTVTGGTSGSDLYFNTDSGVQVPIVQNGALAGTPGSIANLVPPASASYSSLSHTFTFQSSADTAGNIDVGSVIIREAVNNANGITLSSPSSLPADYELTLPSALPTATSAAIVDTSGNVSFAPSFVPSGVMLPYFNLTAPTGWILCNGQAVSRTTFSALFAIMGTSCGSGDGSTTFNVPDLRGRFLRGWDAGTGRDPDANTRTAMASGGNTGNNIGTIQAQSLIAHTHPVSDPGHVHSYPQENVGDQVGAGVLGVFRANGTSNTDSSTTGLTVLGFGGNETRPINAYCTFIIKT